MRQIFAIARLTVRESFRKKILVILIIAGLIVVGTSIFLPSVDAPSRLKVLQSVCLSFSTFFALILSVFLSAVSIPEDIQARRVMVVLAKPVGRWQYFVGKIVGFAVIVFCFIACLTAVALVYIHIAVLLIGEEAGNLSASSVSLPERIIYTGPLSIRVEDAGHADFTLVWDARNAVMWELWNVVGLGKEGLYDAEVRLRYDNPDGTEENEIELEIVNPDTNDKVRVGTYTRTGSAVTFKIPAAQVNPYGIVHVIVKFLRPYERFYPRLSDMAVFTPGLLGGRRRNQALVMHVNARGEVDVGRGERINFSMIGGGVRVARLEFTGLPSGGAPLTARYKLGITNAQRISAFDSGDVGFAISNPQTGHVSRISVFAYNERADTFEVPLKCVSSDGRLLLDVVPLDQDCDVTIRDDSIKVVVGERSFLLNYLKSNVMTFMQCFLIIVVGVTCSTFLSANVSVFLSYFIFFASSISGWLEELVRFLVRSKSMALLPQCPHAHGAALYQKFPVLAEISEAVIRFMMWVFPDFRKFDAAAWVVKGIDVSSRFILDGFLTMLFYVLVATTLGLLVMRFREFQ